MPVFQYGRWWTVLSAGWLHSGVLHILFNMMWVRQLGPACADLYGAGRMVIIYTVAGVDRIRREFSGVAVLRRDSDSRRRRLHRRRLGAHLRPARRDRVVRPALGQQHDEAAKACSYALMLGVFGLIMPGIDNWAHAGGFAGGWLMAKILDPLKPERIDHLRWRSAA